MFQKLGVKRSRARTRPLLQLSWTSAAGTLSILVALCPWSGSSVGAAAGAPARASTPAVPDIPENAAEIRDLATSGGIGDLRVVAPPEAAPPAGPRLTPLAAAIQRLLDAEKTSLAALKTRFDAATDEASALEIEREIEKVKADTEISLLRVQAEYARRDGRPQAAREIESAIEDALRQRAKPASAGTPTSGAAPSGPRP